MPPRWIHDAMDIIWCGRSYWWVHKEKDKHFKTLGKKHRIKEHEYYWKFKDANEFLEKLMELDIRSEEEGVNVTHDLLDKIWAESSPEKREWIAGFFYFLMSNPDTLWQWAGIDPEKGLGKTYYPESNETKIEFDEKLKRDYLNLMKIIEDKTIEELLYLKE